MKSVVTLGSTSSMIRLHGTPFETADILQPLLFRVMIPWNLILVQTFAHTLTIKVGRLQLKRKD